MKILVTGGAGYIGSHTAKALHRDGFEPIVLDNLSYGHESAVKWGPLVKGDLADGAFVRRVLKEHKIEAVIHFAAYTFVGESVTDPKKYFHNNVVNTLNLVDALLEAEIKQIVFSSTCATYGIPKRVPLDESHSQKPISPYGETKLSVERILHWYGKAYGLRSVALRYFNAAGADPEGEIGEDHNPETHLIPLVIQAAMGQRKQIDIYGTDYPTPDGTAIRDYVHVTDLADAHVRALKYLLNGGHSASLNLGTGIGQSVRAVIAAVEKVSNSVVPVHEAPRREGDPAILVANAYRAGDTLGWHPQYADLDQVVQHAWNWAQKQAALNANAK